MLFSKTDHFGTENQEPLAQRYTISDLYVGKSANARKYTAFAIRSLAIFKKILNQEDIMSYYADGIDFFSFYFPLRSAVWIYETFSFYKLSFSQIIVIKKCNFKGIKENINVMNIFGLLLAIITLYWPY